MNGEEKKRKHNCFWCGKGDRKMGLRWIESHPGIKEITYTWPESRKELALLLKGCDILYTMDSNSALLEEARLCGAVVCYIPNAGGYAKTRPHQLDGIFGMAGFAVDDTAKEIQRAYDTLYLYPDTYDTRISTWKMELDNFIKRTQEEFA